MVTIYFDKQLFSHLFNAQEENGDYLSSCQILMSVRSIYDGLSPSFSFNGSFLIPKCLFGTFLGAVDRIDILCEKWFPANDAMTNDFSFAFCHILSVVSL